MTSEENLRVVRNDAAHRYEIYDDGAPSGEPTLAGFAEFQQRPGIVKIFHTEIDHAFRGRGYADVLARRSLDDVIARDEVLWPLCPFYAKFLTENRVDGLRVHWPHGDPEGAATPGTD